MATPTYTPIETYTVTGSAVSSVTLGSGGTIPQTYTDLILVQSSRLNTAAHTTMRFNGDTTSNYSSTVLYGTGSTAGSGRYTSSTAINYGAVDEQGATSTYNVAQWHIQNYTNSTTYKTILINVANPLAERTAGVGLWRKTPEAITSITLTPTNSAQYQVGSTFTLYGIANAAIGAPKATGGIITYDNTYFYHTFGASGTFTPQQSLTADILVVAGGGGGGRIVAGGGGAGGLLGFASQSLSATGYTVTVGSGGAGSTSSSYTFGSNGGDSQFGSLTLVKGGGGGAALSSTGLSGGSGGGASNTGGSGGSATSGQGNAGGSSSVNGSSGGGGGAGAVGQNQVSSSQAGAGGAGSSSYSSWGLATGTGENVSGTYYYAGGGGGGVSTAGATSTNAGAGGLGGGGRGGYTNSSTPADFAAVAGITNTGGGGGGAPNDYSGANTNTYGKNGGSGVVIIRYLKA